MAEISEYISTREASARFGLSDGQLRHLLIIGRVEGLKKGRDWLLTPDSVARYLVNRQRCGLKPGQKINRPRKIALEPYIYVQALPNVGYHLATQLVLRKQRMEPRGVLLSEDRSQAYGAGATEAEALRDFASMLVEMYEHLTEAEGTLSTVLRQRLDYLRSILAPALMPICR